LACRRLACLGDGAGHHAEQLGEHVLGCAEALAQHGDQGLFGEGEGALEQQLDELAGPG